MPTGQLSPRKGYSGNSENKLGTGVKGSPLPTDLRGSKNFTMSYLISRMYAYKPDVLKEALLKCLTSKAYNARMLIEASESIRMSRGTASIPPASKTPVHLPAGTIQPNRTPINSFEQYFNI